MLYGILFSLNPYILILRFLPVARRLPIGLEYFVTTITNILI
jgi:hypothetical protein